MSEKQPKAGWPNFKCHPDAYKQTRQLALDIESKIIDTAIERLTIVSPDLFKHIRQMAIDENKSLIDIATELLTTIRHVVKK